MIKGVLAISSGSPQKFVMRLRPPPPSRSRRDELPGGDVFDQSPLPIKDLQKKDFVTAWMPSLRAPVEFG